MPTLKGVDIAYSFARILAKGVIMQITKVVGEIKSVVDDMTYQLIHSTDSPQDKKSKIVTWGQNHERQAKHLFETYQSKLPSFEEKKVFDSCVAQIDISRGILFKVKNNLEEYLLENPQTPQKENVAHYLFVLESKIKSVELSYMYKPALDMMIKEDSIKKALQNTTIKPESKVDALVRVMTDKKFKGKP